MMLLKRWHDILKVKAKKEDFKISIFMTVIGFKKGTVIWIINQNARFSKSLVQTRPVITALTHAVPDHYIIITMLQG
jgi:hypothetical protein